MLRAHSRPSPRKPNHGHHLLYHQAICPQSRRRHSTRKKQNQCQREQNNKKSSYSRK